MFARVFVCPFSVRVVGWLNCPPRGWSVTDLTEIIYSLSSARHPPVRPFMQAFTFFDELELKTETAAHVAMNFTITHYLNVANSCL